MRIFNSSPSQTVGFEFRHLSYLVQTISARVTSSNCFFCVQLETGADLRVDSTECHQYFIFYFYYYCPKICIFIVGNESIYKLQGPSLGFCTLCQHFFEHFSEAKALSIIRAFQWHFLRKINFFRENKIEINFFQEPMPHELLLF